MESIQDATKTRLEDARGNGPTSSAKILNQSKLHRILFL